MIMIFLSKSCCGAMNRCRVVVLVAVASHDLTLIGAFGFGMFTGLYCCSWRFVFCQDLQYTCNLMLVAFPWRYCLVDPCTDAYIGGDPRGPFSMDGGVAAVNGLCDFVPWTLWMIVGSSEWDKLGMKRINLDWSRSRLMTLQSLESKQCATSSLTVTGPGGQ